jgi:hypothetical protein
MLHLEKQIKIVGVVDLIRYLLLEWIEKILMVFFIDIKNIINIKNNFV